jgi:predicted SnoaL-like aldol condensation-catalyzing enzyme
MIDRRVDRLGQFIDGERFTQHDPELEDGATALKAALEAVSGDHPTLQYERLHRVLAEGSFVLSVSEGFRAGVHSSFYDLFRVAEDKLVEHWDTIEAVPPPSEWKNDNGKF